MTEIETNLKSARHQSIHTASTQLIRGVYTPQRTTPNRIIDGKRGSAVRVQLILKTGSMQKNKHSSSIQIVQDWQLFKWRLSIATGTPRVIKHFFVKKKDENLLAGS